MKADFLYNPPDKGLYCHVPTLLETTAGSLLAIWYTYSEEEHIDGSLVLSRRDQGRADWSASVGILSDLKHPVGNPVLFQEPEGTIRLFFVILNGKYWNDAELQECYSIDEGRTWSRPTTIWPQRGIMVRHPPLLLDDGSLLLPAYDENAHESVLLSSRPPHTKWKEAHRFVNLPLIQPVLIKQDAAHILFFRPASDPRQIWRSRSVDAGHTWSTPVRTPLPTPLSGIAAFALEGKIAVVYNHTEIHQRYPLSIALSSDGGVTWSAPWHVDSVHHELSYPSFFCDSNGCIHGAYTYNRRMIKYVSFPADWICRDRNG